MSLQRGKPRNPNSQSAQNRQSDFYWQEIVTILKQLDQKYITSLSTIIKPNALITLLGQPNQIWNSISKFIQRNFVTQLLNIKHLLQNNSISLSHIMNSRSQMNKCGNENHIVVNLARKIVNYCELFSKEHQPTQPIMKQEELKKIEEDIINRKSSLSKFLEGAYAEQDEISNKPAEQRVCVTPPKSIYSLSLSYSKTQEKTKYLNEHQQCRTPNKTQDYKNQFQSQQTKSSIKSVSPIPQSRQKKNHNDNNANNISYLDIRNQIKKSEQHIKQLQATENKLNWVVDRDAKRMLKDQEREDERQNLGWNREEVTNYINFQRQRNIDHARQKKEDEYSFVKQNKSFKQMLTSPRSNQPVNKSSLRILTAEEEVIVEEIEKYKDQYKTLCSQLGSTIRRQDELQKDLNITLTVIKKKKRLELK